MSTTDKATAGTELFSSHAFAHDIPQIECEPSQNKEPSKAHEACKRQRKGSKVESDMKPGSNRSYTNFTGVDEKRETPSLDPDGSDSPDDFLKKLLRSEFGIEINDDKTECQAVKPGFFAEISEDEKSSYAAVVASARSNNVSELLSLLEEGHSLNCCNQFGESLLHISCRRGFVAMTRLILDQPGASVRLVDDCGRTPLHDLCWNPTPQLDICKWILEVEPSLFFLKDRRNFTPFDYARREHWSIWKEFVLENKKLFHKLVDGDCYSFLKK